VSKHSITLATTLSRRAQNIESTRRNIELIAQNGELGLMDVERTYEGLFLNVVIAFEGFLEDLFVGLLIDNAGVKSSRKDIVPRIQVRSHKIAREVILATSARNYVDWLPYQRTINISNVFFRGGRPFSELNDQQLNHLMKCQTIRNVIAHKSRFSYAQFEKRVIGNRNLPTNERKPAGYMRGIFRTQPNVTRFENLAVQTLQIVQQLAR